MPAAFSIKSAVELRGGYDTNPGRLPTPQGSPFWVVAPEFLAVSDWERHALVADLRGSFTGYGNSLPPIVDGADLAGADQCQPAGFHSATSMAASTSPKIPTSPRKCACASPPTIPAARTSRPALPAIPIYATFGGTFGFDQRFNRLEISAGATVDRTVYQNSTLTDGTISSNDDRAFNQYGGVGRVSYELTPAVKPFVEVEGDSRFHDQQLDNSGYARNSSGGYAKAGTSFEFSRLLTGEISVGFAARNYVDPRLEPAGRAC